MELNNVIKNIFGIPLNSLWFGEKSEGQELSNSNHETAPDDNENVAGLILSFINKYDFSIHSH